MPPNAGRDLHARLAADLRVAMKARDRVRIRALRAGMAAIDNGEAVEIDHRPGWDPATGLGAAEADRAVLGAARLAALLGSEIDERTRSAAELRRHGQDQRAAALDAEAAVLRTYRDDMVR